MGAIDDVKYGEKRFVHERLDADRRAAEVDTLKRILHDEPYVPFPTDDDYHEGIEEG